MKYTFFLTIILLVNSSILFSQENPTNRKAYVCKECKNDVFIGKIDVCNNETVRENLVSYYWYNVTADVSTGKDRINAEYLFYPDGKLLVMDKFGTKYDGTYSISACRDTMYKSYGAHQAHATKYAKVNISFNGFEHKMVMIGDDYIFMNSMMLKIKIGRPDQSIIDPKLKQEAESASQVKITATYQKFEMTDRCLHYYTLEDGTEIVFTNQYSEQYASGMMECSFNESFVGKKFNIVYKPGEVIINGPVGQTIIQDKVIVSITVIE